MGIVNDFNTGPLHQTLEPVVLVLNDHLSNTQLFIKYREGEASKALEEINAVYSKLEPDFTLKYSFLDAAFQELYKTEKISSVLATIFTLVALFISVLGIVGLATFTMLRRLKEIGIRRVLGASLAQMLALLSNDFLKIALLAAVIILPVAWYFCNEWLNTFAYHIETPWISYFMTVAGILIMTVCVIVLQCLRTINTNPATILKDE